VFRGRKELMRWLLLLLLLWLTLRTLRRRGRAIHEVGGVRRIRALRDGAGIFRGVRWRRLHRVGVLVPCVRLGRLWLLRPRAPSGPGGQQFTWGACVCGVLEVVVRD
jgi:hypothetical protein